MFLGALEQGAKITRRKRTFAPNALDETVLHLLGDHRVLTTSQLIAATSSPERTVDHRLSRLQGAGLVARTRPYRDRGSAPYHWWLAPAGLRLVGRDTTTRPASQPNPLFLAHTTAVAGLWLALREAPALELVGWEREEAAWEEWASLGRPNRISPDATATFSLAVDDTPAQAAAFVEVDLATMAQDRLQAKVTRYRRYTSDGAWEGRHPHCPVLLLLTTSPARAERFLAALARRRQREEASAQFLIADEQPHEELVVAGAGLVHDPARAVAEAVWRTAPNAAPVSLVDLLASAVRVHRRRSAWEATIAAQVAERAPHDAAYALRTSAERAGQHVGDGRAAEALTVAMAGLAGLPLSEQERWVEDHAEVVLAVWEWWSAQPAWHSRYQPAEPAPAPVVEQLLGLHEELWVEQAEEVLGAEEAVAMGDPRLVPLAGRLMGGHLIAPRDLERIADLPLDGASAQAEALGDYPTRRAAAVAAKRQALPWRERRATTRRLWPPPTMTSTSSPAPAVGFLGLTDPASTATVRSAWASWCPTPSGQRSPARRRPWRRSLGCFEGTLTAKVGPRHPVPGGGREPGEPSRPAARSRGALRPRPPGTPPFEAPEAGSIPVRSPTPPARFKPACNRSPTPAARKGGGR